MIQEWSKTVYKKVSNPFIKFAVKIGMTGNQITILNHFITLTFGCYFFSRGTWLGFILGLGVCLINGFLDYLDGDVARETKNLSKLGIWLDSGFDVIVQNAIMGSIAIGCFKIGLPLFWVVLFLVSNSANNFISFNYNSTFGFDSDKGNELFRKCMENKNNLINRFLKNVIDPTSNYPSLLFFTYRYWIALGCTLNIMPICFVAMTLISTVKWIIMYLLYALHLAGENRLYVLQALSILDEETNEFYRIRGSK